MANDLRVLGPWVSTGDFATVNDATPLFAPGQLGVIAPSLDDLPVTGSSTNLATVQIPRICQYVQLDSASATPVQGQRLIWKDTLNFVVTTVASDTTGRNREAGVLLNASATLGNYIWIGVSGVFPVLCTAATPAAAGSLHGSAVVAEWGFTAAGTAPAYNPCGSYLTAKAGTFNGVTAGANVAFAYVNVPRVGF